MNLSTYRSYDYIIGFSYIDMERDFLHKYLCVFQNEYTSNDVNK